MPRALHRLTASGRTQSALPPRDDIGIDPAPVVRYSEHSSVRRISQQSSAPASRSGSPPEAGDEPSQTRVPPSSTRSSWRPRNSRARCSTRASSSRAAAWQRTGRTRGRPIPTRRSNRSHRASRGSHHHRRQFRCRSDPSRPIRHRRAHHHRGPQVRRRVTPSEPWRVAGMSLESWPAFVEQTRRCPRSRHHPGSCPRPASRSS